MDPTLTVLSRIIERGPSYVASRFVRWIKLYPIFYELMNTFYWRFPLLRTAVLVMGRVSNG
jgi:hypothetical protein